MNKFDIFTTKNRKNFKKYLVVIENSNIFAPRKTKNIVFGEMAEWSIAAVLKTVEGNTSGGSNPSLSAKHSKTLKNQGFSCKKKE